MDHAKKFSDIPSDLEDHPLMQEDFEEVEAEDAVPADDNLSRELELLRTRNEQLMRIAADFENYKRRQEREREELNKFAGQQIITGLLPVLDNFERALQAEPNPEDIAKFVEGIRMIHRQFLEVMT